MCFHRNSKINCCDCYGCCNCNWISESLNKTKLETPYTCIIFVTCSSISLQHVTSTRLPPIIVNLNMNKGKLSSMPCLYITEPLL